MRIEELRKLPPDAELASSLNALAWEGLYYLEAVESEVFAAEAGELAEKLGLEGERARSLLTLAVLKQDTGDFKEALLFCRRAMEVYESVNDKRGMTAATGSRSIHTFRVIPTPGSPTASARTATGNCMGSSTIGRIQ